MFEIEDESGSEDKRRWKWGPVVHCTRVYASIGWALCILQYRDRIYKFGEPHSIIQGWFLEFHFKSPKKWEIGSSHMYYDGPNCAWYCGPFSFYRCGTGCKKCYDGAY